mmetsp:Transcript_29546/g.55274  ORF Transcript_29546/g.55274 Transcript_29546/m.55274 type:complete len:88 (-) Transcript_29546:518-781(-)|eukprot:CAMPEP_0170185250 /NCGR_PEP_ID=MMETSP0040_2-20121228/36118_1 /TAXON_ID=641309 /ORGANISM="Lotharella oceanica, Strain CCMP622" /LENGTH=87 /DNA_ID=CAMNT_0010431597 /DNA_START=314 /DNA_END=577 /DNA_ORIENTATION=+
MRLCVGGELLRCSVQSVAGVLAVLAEVTEGLRRYGLLQNRTRHPRSNPSEAWADTCQGVAYSVDNMLKVDVGDPDEKDEQPHAKLEA